MTTADRLSRGAVDGHPGDTHAPGVDDEPVTTGLLPADADPWPSTGIRDWIVLQPQNVVSDGAFRLYCLSRSLLAARSDTATPTVTEVTYDDYARIMGRSARSIARLARDLYDTGLWEIVERHTSPDPAHEADHRRTPTRLTVRVRDLPRVPGEHRGPTSALDALREIRGHRPPDARASGEAPANPAPEPDEPTARPAGTTQPPGPAPAGLDDELAMFTPDAAELVARLCQRAAGLPDAQPLTTTDRVGLARRIDSRLAEGWSLTRVRAVLDSSSIDNVRAPGRVWAARLDDMPPYRSYGTAEPPHTRAPRPPATADPPSTPADGDHDQHPARRRSQPAARATATGTRTAGGAAAHSRRVTVQTNDCANLPDPNPGRTRYEIPHPTGKRMVAVWADDRTVSMWCGRCSADSRCLRPTQGGPLGRPCPECHPDPGAFPPELPSQPATSRHHDADDASEAAAPADQTTEPRPGRAPAAAARKDSAT